MQGAVDFLKALGVTRLAAMGAVTAALIGFFAFLILRVTAPVMTPLFTDLSMADATAIIKELDRQVGLHGKRGGYGTKRLRALANFTKDRDGQSGLFTATDPQQSFGVRDWQGPQ